ncbi:TPA: restriction endonuclease subunit S [Listeria monocytogenes]|uniref:restriction endonuclease subunit S n=6 Tax=Listeria monocytogenes TaxID=1639 RepID=UPI00042EE9E0|nr:restriction endonuclease subunit S [Listeria monocytogenes]EAE3750364.1 restriction endonuclease subunit S [Listeria monocytogenes serotype 1/2a]AHF40210.1 type I restriction enzyme, S subunit [Listeria monocytogenes serotype 1/2a str. 10-1047]ASH01983.1 type I restriction enzyme, S subunit [Listeria monocytogenes serotype 1/2a str. 02-5993]ASH04931.1 type I restriction enzyme, S subunit [Listeria monocytogenes serotype 1/2a str. 04-5457]ASH13818.1 type I restriction enzyme, S subunit [List
MKKLEKSVPVIRFKGFSEAWEQRKLGEIANSFEYGLNASSKTYDGENKYIRITDIDESSHVFNQDNLTSPNISLDKLNHYLLEEGDILLARTGASTGKSYYYSKMDGKVFFAGFLIRAKIKQEYNVSFIFQNTLTERYNNFIQVTSQRSGQPGINAQEYARFALYIPELKEQQKIGVFFKQLDNAIALHQRKLDTLKRMKKGFLQQMFPNNEEKVPRLRFADFDEEWEQRMLNEIANRYDNLRVPITASARSSGTTPYYGANGIQDYVEGFTHDGEFILVAEDGANDVKNYPVQYVNGKIWVNNHAHVLQAKENKHDNKFLMNAIKILKIEPFLVGGGRAKLNSDVMMTLMVKFPCYEGQKKIGTFLQRLDNTITLHKNKINKLSSLKKTYLQNMFI